MPAMQSIDEILPLTIKKLGIIKRYNAESAIVHWQEIVGEKIAMHAYPIAIYRDLLVVAVGNSSWLHHLSMMKQDIISKINTFIGEDLISDIRFQAGYLKDNKNQKNAGQADENEIKLQSIKLETADIEAADQLVREVNDTELRNKIKCVVIKSFTFKKLRQKQNWHKCSWCTALCPPGESLCAVCKLNKKRKVKEDIYVALRENPWLGYSELKKYINVSFDEFKDVKEQLISKLIQDISSQNSDRIKELTLVMLVTGVKPEQITDALINNTLKRFRRSKHVSTSRS